MTVAATIERRLLVNYRAHPDAIAPLLPYGLRPQLVEGQAVVGVCFIRLGGLRPEGLPAWLGVRSESAAHRVAVEWEEEGTVRRGVYIPRRDTDAASHVLAGGRLFPGVHHRADFTVDESPDRWSVSFAARDGEVSAGVEAFAGAGFESALFPDVEAASRFFRDGAVGLSPSRDATRLEAIELDAAAWTVEPVTVVDAHSSLFGAAAVFDNALVMRGIPVRWHRRAPLIGLTGDRVRASGR